MGYRERFLSYRQRNISVFRLIARLQVEDQQAERLSVHSTNPHAVQQLRVQ